MSADANTRASLTNQGTRAVCHGRSASGDRLLASAALRSPFIDTVVSAHRRGHEGWPSLPIMRGAPLVATGALLAVSMGLTACTTSSPIEGTARNAAVVEQVIRSIVEDEPTEPDVMPVVYVVGGETSISIDVQASVAASLVNEMDIRFADERAEAIDESLEQAPVRDAGVLLVIGKVPNEGRRIDVLAERYRAVDDVDNVVVSLRWREPEWSVTSTTVLPPLIE
jgi:hypothetical protein